MCEKCLNIVVSVSQPVIVVAPLAVEHKLNICEVGAPSAAHSPDSVQVSGIRNTQLYIWRCYTTVSQALGGETQCPAAHHGITTIVIVPETGKVRGECSRGCGRCTLCHNSGHNQDQQVDN